MKNILLHVSLMLCLFSPGISTAFDFNPFKSNSQARETPRDFTVALELNSGLRDSEEIINPYFTGSVRLYAEIAYLDNIARVAPFIGGAFENPGGSFELGIRNDFRIFKIESSSLPLGEIRAGLSYYYSFKNKKNAIGVDVKFEAADILYLSLRYNKILDGSEYNIMPGFGINF